MGASQASHIIECAASSETHFSRKEVIAIRDYFNSVAVESKGTPNDIEFSQFKEALQSFGFIPSTNEFLLRVFQVFDIAHSGVINFREFVVGLSALTRGTPEEKLDLIFHIFDVNETGVITRDEMEWLLGSLFKSTGLDYNNDIVQGDVRKFVDRVFDGVKCGNSDYLDREAFSRALIMHPELLSVMSKT